MSHDQNNIHPTAEVASTAHVASSSRVWSYAQVREDATIGESCTIGRSVYIGPGVSIGDNCKIQNNALVYEPAFLESGVFIGPAVVLTNDQFPRAINLDGSPKSASDWKAVGVVVRTGASIGANATCIAPVTIGAWSLVGSGSVVTRDVPAFALFVGNPGHRVGWVGKSGQRLSPIGEQGILVCPSTGQRYREVSANELQEIIDSSPEK